MGSGWKPMKWESGDGIPTETNGRKKEEMTDASGAFDVCLVSSSTSSSTTSSSSFQSAFKILWDLFIY